MSEKQLPDIDPVLNDELPSILENFYAEVCKKNAAENDENASLEDSNSKRHKNTTLKSIRSALVRHFKQTCLIDIIKNENFIRANEVFQGIQQINKTDGFGEIKSIPPMNDPDLKLMMDYFTANMQAAPNAKTYKKLFCSMCYSTFVIGPERI